MTLIGLCVCESIEMYWLKSTKFVEKKNIYKYYKYYKYYE